MNRNLSLAIHLLGCLTVLALPYLLVNDGFGKLAELPVNPHEQRNLLSYLLTIAFFYGNFYGLIPALFIRRKYVLYSVCVLGCFLLVQGILVTINRQTNRFAPTGRMHYPPPVPADRPFSGNYPPPPGDAAGAYPKQPGLPSETSQTFFLFLAGLLLSLAIRINNRWRETERERLNTELSFLKAQINPHFLFNSLNSIYSLAIEQSAATADAIIQLSSFLRYVIAEGQQDRIALGQELAYIGHYIALQKLRLDDTVPLQFVTQGQANGLQIAPLLLISFIENAFKYGVSPQEPSHIDIRISITGPELRCHVFNRKVRVSSLTALSSGIGLGNTKARLALLYPGRHQLLIRDEPASFTVDLTLTLS